MVHVFRLATLPRAAPWLFPAQGAPERHLDLDDVESTTRRRVAALCRANGDDRVASAEEAEAERARAVEDQVLQTFDRVYVCSEADRQELLPRASAQLCVLPNALTVPSALSPREASGPFTLLFIGTLGYYPNADGLRYFCADVVPMLRRIAPGQFRVIVVGVGANRETERITALPDVQLVGAVQDVVPWYAQANAVVVPIRAGGGTRIKVLEAFSYRRPVVSTSVGVEGVDVQHGEHVLIADTPEAFAQQGARLMADPALGRSLAERALALFSGSYSIEAAASALDACSPPRPRRGWRSVFGWRAPR